MMKPSEHQRSIRWVPPCEEKRGHSTFLLTASYGIDFAIHFFDIEMKGMLDTDIAILNGTDQTQLASKPLNSTYREGLQMALDGAFEDAPRGALLEFIRSFARDPTVLEALRSVALQKEKR